MPTTKLESKVKVGSKEIKKYDEPRSPYQRLLESDALPPAVKAELTRPAIPNSKTLYTFNHYCQGALIPILCSIPYILVAFYATLKNLLLSCHKKGRCIDFSPVKQF
jgi:hypothetical protein